MTRAIPAGGHCTRFAGRLAAGLLLALLWSGSGNTVSPDSRLDEGFQAYFGGAYGASTTIAREILSGEATDADALLLLGWSLYQVGRFGEALAAFEAADRNGSGSADPAIGMAWARFKLGDIGQAEELFLAVRRNAIGDQEFIVEDGLGWIAYVRGDYAAAREHFSAAPGARGRGPVPHDGELGPAWIALTVGDLTAAEAHLRAGLDAQPGYFRLHHALGLLALYRGRYPEALGHALTGLATVPSSPEMLRLVDAILRRGDDSGARVEQWRDLSSEFPGVAGILVALGWSEIDAGNFVAAERAFLEALEIDPETGFANSGLRLARARMNAVVRDAWQLYEAGEFREALAAFGEWSGIAHQNPAIDTGRGWSQFMLGDFDAAVNSFRRALAVDPAYGSALAGIEALAQGALTVYFKGWDLVESGNLQAAAYQFERARPLLPPDRQWIVDEGAVWVTMLEGETQAAASAFQAILESRPRAYLSIKGAGYAALARGDHDTALRYLLASYAIEPRQILSSYTVPAARFLDGGRYTEAFEVLRVGRNVYPNFGRVAWLLARTHAGSGDIPAAAREAERAARLAPLYVHGELDGLGIAPERLREAYRIIADTLYQAGDYEGAAGRASDFMNAGGEDPAVRRNRGFALYRLGRYAEAIVDLTAVVEQASGDLPPVRQIVEIPGTGEHWEIVFDARSTLAWAYLLAGEPDRAAEHFRAALAVHPGWIDALCGLGYSLLATERPDEAARHFREAFLLSPGYPDAWQGLARVGAVQ